MATIPEQLAQLAAQRAGPNGLSPEVYNLAVARVLAAPAAAVPLIEEVDSDRAFATGLKGIRQWMGDSIGSGVAPRAKGKVFEAFSSPSSIVHPWARDTILRTLKENALHKQITAMIVAAGDDKPLEAVSGATVGVAIARAAVIQLLREVAAVLAAADVKGPAFRDYAALTKIASTILEGTDDEHSKTQSLVMSLSKFASVVDKANGDTHRGGGSPNKDRSGGKNGNPRNNTGDRKRQRGDRPDSEKVCFNCAGHGHEREACTAPPASEQVRENIRKMVLRK